MPKSYEIKKSFLYELMNRKKLGEALDISSKILRYELDQFINYKRIIKDVKGKKRKIDLPSIELKKVQKKLVKFLNRIEKPKYLMSGIKGYSYIDNAKQHLGKEYILVMDVSNFYPNCKKEYVYEMFIEKFKMSVDIATILTKLTTHKQTIPTGVATSQVIAYYAYSKMFDNINKIAEKYNCDFSLYVDDMTFSSSNKISKAMEKEIKEEVKKYNHLVKKEKTFYFKPENPKKITGVYLVEHGESLSVPNSLRKDIVTLMKIIESKYINKINIEYKLIEQLTGKILAAQQIEPNLFKELNKKLNKIKKTRLD